MTQRQAKRAAQALLGSYADTSTLEAADGQVLCVIRRYVRVYHCGRCSEHRRGYWVNEGMGASWESALADAERATMSLAAEWCSEQDDTEILSQEADR